MAWSEGLRDTLRFWPLVLVAFVHAVASCSLLGLSFQQASEAQEVDRHLQRWEQLGAASLRGFYLAAPGHLEGGGAAPGESQQDRPSPTSLPTPRPPPPTTVGAPPRCWPSWRTRTGRRTRWTPTGTGSATTSPAPCW